MSEPTTKLSLGALIALAAGSMIGSGIFALPQNMAASASVGVVLVGWSITAIGMLALALIFQNLANRKPELDAGIYAYAKAGFGDYIGFSSAWGYWISSWVGSVSYLVLVFSTLGHFFPIFGEGNTVAAVICASALLWSYHLLVLRGIRLAASINLILTIAKVVPIALFIIIVAAAFKPDVFFTDFWGAGDPNLGGWVDQLRHVMFVTVWVFMGIEGANMYSARAARRVDVGKATVIGFLGVLLLLVAVSVLSMGVLRQPELAALQDPSMAGVLEHIVGHRGSLLISTGLLISLGGALLAWILMCSEILFASASDHTMPSFLKKENVNKVPSNALWLSNGLIQLFLVVVLFNESTYLSLFYLATAMMLVPYLWSAAYALLVTWRSETYGGEPRTRNKDLAIAAVATLYSVWLLYAGGGKYVLLSALLYAPGALFFAKAKREQGQPVFKPYEWVIFIAVLIGAGVAAYGLYAGFLSL